jgi:hypothetical protein
MELPVLRLGLAGFAPEQEHSIRAIAAARPALHWICGPLGGADAWLINGARTQTHGGGAIRVAPGVPGGRSVQLQVDAAHRPLGFALPLPGNVDAACTFDLHDPATVHRALEQLEGALVTTQAQLWLAARIVDHEGSLGSGVFELHADGQLAAVVDMHGEVAVQRSAALARSTDVTWKQVARDGKKVPPQFSRARLEHILWQYCSRTGRDVLPPRYRTRAIHFRHPPRVEPHWIRDEHLVVLRDLAVQPATFDQLAQRTGLREDQLARALGALYYVGSVTSNARRANPDSSSSGLLSVQTDLQPDPTVPNYREMTAPAPLRA